MSPGHALLVPKRHVPSWFEASPEEKAELIAGIEIARHAIESRHQPDGFNVGINIGQASGQTVPHLHVHLIPRYAGDVSDPRGGVRHVIPEKGNYPATPLEPGSVLADRIDRAAIRDLPHSDPLVVGGADPLLPHVLAHLDSSIAADIAVAFVFTSGVALIAPHLRELLERGGRLRIVTGTYLDVTEPDALLELLDIQEEFRDRVGIWAFVSAHESFHPKAYIFYDRSGEGIAFVGSSNLTRTGLTSGTEWNFRTVTSRDRAGFPAAEKAFSELLGDPRVRSVDVDWVESYRKQRRPEPTSNGAAPETPPPPPEPHEVQTRALGALEDTRARGNTAGLVVLATGLGKTWLSAFDSQRPEFRRVLFVAHREEILRQAMATFRRIRPGAHLGLYTGQEKAPRADVLFASIQTLGRTAHLECFEPKEFDYIVVDEFHHACARTYRRLIDYFEPKFLLGLTATPEMLMITRKRRNLNISPADHRR